MNEMNITSAQYYDDPMIEGTPDGIKATIDGVVMFVPLCEGNRHYAEIMRQVDAGTLTIEESE